MTRERLMADRMRKLEATIRAYDACLNTGRIDAMRKRIAELEQVLSEVAGGGDLSEGMRKAINLILSKKFL